MSRYKMVVRDFISLDLERLDIREIDKPDFPVLKELAKRGLLNPGATLLKNTMPILSAGFIIAPYNSVAEIWIVCDKEAEYFKKERLYYCSEYLGRFAANYRIRRVQATIRVEHKECQRFIEAIGFKKEGVMKKYSVDGKDCIMYGRVE